MLKEGKADCCRRSILRVQVSRRSSRNKASHLAQHTSLFLWEGGKWSSKQPQPRNRILASFSCNFHVSPYFKSWSHWLFLLSPKWCQERILNPFWMLNIFGLLLIRNPLLWTSNLLLSVVVFLPSWYASFVLCHVAISLCMLEIWTSLFHLAHWSLLAIHQGQDFLWSARTHTCVSAYAVST